MSSPLLSVRSLSKSYNRKVLNGINLDFFSAEVHALMGSNGAGKSTLCQIIAGIRRADTGDLLLHDKHYAPTSLKEAKRSGVRIAVQELNQISELSVAENISLDDFPCDFGFINRNKVTETAKLALERIGLNNIDPDTILGSLSPGQQQLVQISSALNGFCQLLILDEPTASPSEEQIALLLNEIEELKRKQVGIIYVSHRIDEVFQIADRISVLRDGDIVDSRLAADLDKDELIRLMSNSVEGENYQRNRVSSTHPVLKAENISTSERLRGIHLNLHAGEILGLAGLMGSGRTEVLRALSGRDSLSEGTVTVELDDSVRTNYSSLEAVGFGLYMIAEDRKSQGLLHNLSILQNIGIAGLWRFQSIFGWLDTQAESENVRKLIDELKIDCHSPQQSINELSGGNQQKVLLARCLLNDPEILFFDEPTRGIDIGTKRLIYDLLRLLADKGKAIIVVSSEESELYEICDRIAVISNGFLAKDFEPDEWSPEKITAAAFSHYTSEHTGT